MYDYRNIDWLAHHGVQGQKWHVKHGPPYPLSRQKGSGRLVGKVTINKNKSKNDDYRYTHKRPKYVQPIPGIKIKTVPETTMTKDILAVNPNVESGDEYQTNCLYCSLTMEMRCRGYDVQAQPVNKKYNDYAYTEKIKDWGSYNGLFSPPSTVNVLKTSVYDTNKIPTDQEKEQLRQNAKTIIQKMPNNARGEMSFAWDYNNEDGHSVFFEKSSEGDVLIIDSQWSEVWSIDDCELFMSASAVTFNRLDNLDIDINKVKDFCK